MLGLVTQGATLSISQLSSSSEKSNVSSTDEISIVSLQKKDKIFKETDRISSPVSSSRQDKMFSNMNNPYIRPDQRCSSPSISSFCNLRNDGEKVSPKMDKTDKDLMEMSDREVGDESSSFRSRKELPMLEWSNANPPSLSASPSASILKRMQDLDTETPNRVSKFCFIY